VRTAASLTARLGVAVIAMVLAGWFLQWPASGGAARAGTPAPVTFQVNSTADSHDGHPGNGKCSDSSGRCTLRAAVEAASAEPAGTAVTITVPAGHYVLMLGSLDLATNTVSLVGAGSASTVIRATGVHRVVQVGAAATAALSGVTITGGNAGPASYGGGIYSAGQLAVSQSVISDNKAVAGGGIANAGGTLTVSHSTVTGNRAPYYGGGGIQNGGLRNVPGFVQVTDSTISGNVTGGDGGGILNGQNGHPARAHLRAAGVQPACPRIRRCAARHGLPQLRRAASGGAGLNLIVAGTVLSGNISSNAGGAIASEGGTAVVTGSTLTGNSARAGVGGGISAYGSLSVGRSTVSWNGASYGGGIEAYDGNGPVPSKAVVTQSTISHNKAGVGGAIDASTKVRVTRSTLVANQAGQGGGIEDDATTIHVGNSTVTGNIGGGIQTYACGGGTVAFTTMDGNSAGLILSCPDLLLTGTIVAAATSGANCTGAAPAEKAGYNLDSGTSCGFAKATDLTRADPLLGPLARSGGPTMTQTLGQGSPAIGHAGTRATGCPATDQRGLSRPWGRGCDVGSVEVRHR
jgi:CSLREA domain-containing protein